MIYYTLAMETNRLLTILVIILSIIVFVDIARRINTYFINHHITIRGSNNGVHVYSYRHPEIPNYNEFDFNDNSNDSRIYNDYMYRIMMHYWKNPLDNEDLHAEVQAIINRNGKITSYQLTKTSNSPVYDKAAINSILNTSPFQPFLDNMPGDERLFTFYFNGSRAGANGFTYRNDRRAPLEISINQSAMQTKHPQIRDIKRARISCDRNYCYCNIWDKWRPSLTETSKLSIEFTINKDLSTSIKNVEKINDTYATEKAIEAVNSAKCENYPDKYPMNITYTFYVE